MVWQDGRHNRIPGLADHTYLICLFIYRRWLFILTGAITLPVSFIGFALFPGLINSKRRWWFTEEEHELAVTRLTHDHGIDNGVNLQTIKDVLRKPMIWICVPSYM